MNDKEPTSTFMKFPLAIGMLSGFLFLVITSAAAQAPLTDVLGHYEGVFQLNLLQSSEIPFDLYGMVDGNVRFEARTGRNTVRTFYGTYDPVEGMLRLRQDGAGRESELYFDADLQQLIGTLTSNGTATEVQLQRDDGRASRRRVEEYQEALEDWEESRGHTFDQAKGDRQKCFVFGHWMNAYVQQWPKLPQNDLRTRVLPLLSDDRFEPVFGRTYAGMDRDDRYDWCQRIDECLDNEIPPSLVGGRNGPWEELYHAFYNGGANWVAPAVVQINRARAEYIAELERIRALASEPNAFWRAYLVEWDEVSTLDAEDIELIFWDSDRERWEEARADVMRKSAETALVEWVDRMLAAGDDRGARHRMIKPGEYAYTFDEPITASQADEARGGSAAQRARAAAAQRRAAEGGSEEKVDTRVRTARIEWEEMLSLVPEKVRRREQTRLDARIAELEAEVVRKLDVRIAALDRAEDPWAEGAAIVTR